MLHGLPVDGLIRLHLCGPAWELRARRAAEVMPDSSASEGAGDSVDRAPGELGETDVAPDSAPESLLFCACER